MDALQDDAGDGSMLCTEHPFKNNTPAGGICAFCLQEKLGKLVSSSFPITVFPSSSSSSPSFRSDIGPTTGITTTAAAAVAAVAATSNTQINAGNECRHHYSNQSRILYLLGQKKKKKDLDTAGGGNGGGYDRNKNLVFKRSKSTAFSGGYDRNMNTNTNMHHKRGFWSFLYSYSSSSTKKPLRGISSNTLTASAASSFQRSQQAKDIIVVEENESPSHASFDRKVSRSRSVGCGSRSFSGDFFERISTGFGDCTLRRVESQREGKPKGSVIQERVRCGGLFSGFMITSSSSSSSSSSNWVGSNNNNNNNNNEGNATTGKVTSAVAGTGQPHSRSKSWGWALASPMRAFSKPSHNKKEALKKNPTPNLAAIPSLLSVGS